MPCWLPGAEPRAGCFCLSMRDDAAAWARWAALKATIDGHVSCLKKHGARTSCASHMANGPSASNNKRPAKFRAALCASFIIKARRQRPRIRSILGPKPAAN